MTIAGEFRRRAFFEANRYGGDGWVFVRELLQNSRDAGAGRVEFTVERRDGVDRIVCRDDGCGMSFEHAQQYLFTLYASSKRDQDDTAGRFGIGFWAILRYRPDEVVVRSAGGGEPGWELRLSGDLHDIDRSESGITGGTEIELSRQSRGADPVGEVWRAIRRDARHLRRRDTDGEILDVRVNGRRATAEFKLDEPTFDFARSGLRGAVALADQPRVDLLAHGLRVRTTATLDELLTRPEGRWRRPRDPKGLVPRVILDSRRLQVLMARGDARTDHELRRLVAAGRWSVRRLVRDQLDRQAGLGWLSRTASRGRELVSSSWARRFAAGAAVVALLTAGGWMLTKIRSGGADGVIVFQTPIMGKAAGSPIGILEDGSAERYRGPAADLFQPFPARIDLRYQPSMAKPMLVVFRVRDMDDLGRVAAMPAGDGHRPFVGVGCAAGCLEIELDLADVGGRLRLPVPTGHVLDPSSVSVVGGSGSLWAAMDGGPLLVIDKQIRGRVRYRTGPGRQNGPVVGGSWPKLPPPIAAFAEGLRPMAADEAAVLATAWVRRRVVYDTSDLTVASHREAAETGIGFADRCLAIGAGDCDVQNALLASMLHHAGVPVRLAIGFAGAGGEALPGLHAWVEYLGDGGMWRTADAGTGSGNSQLAGEPAVAAATAGDARGSLVQPPPSVEREEIERPALSTGKTGAIAVVGLFVVGAVMAVRRRMTILKVPSTRDPDLAGLLRGALTRPETYGEVPALFSRRVVPILGGSTISLDGARALARRSRLAVSSAATPLARRAAKTGLPVIDGGRSEGRAVAETLGAVDLDRWDRISRQGGGHPLIERLRDAAASVGEEWDVTICPDVSGDVAVLDGPLAGLGRRRRVVAVHRDGSLWNNVVTLGATEPETAVLLLGDRVVEELRMSPERSSQLMSHLAARAVIEKSGHRS